MSMLFSPRFLFFVTLLIPLGFGSIANAESTPVAHYHLKADEGAVRDTAAPRALKSFAPGAPDLIVHGAPKVMSSAPPVRATDYTGSIKFEDAGQCYSTPQNLVNAHSDNVAVEVWAYALKGSDDGLHAVLASGDGGKGFLICQMKDRWALYIGGDGATDLGPVQPASWTHLAIVKSGGAPASGYINGKKVAGHISGVGSGAANFSLGASAPGREAFNGWIAEARISTFKPGRFDPAVDFLLDPAQAKAARGEERAAKVKAVESLLATPGIQVVEAFDETPAQDDWLIKPPTTHASVQVLPGKDKQSAKIMLGNGLVSRTFMAGDNLACVSVRRSDKGTEFVRAVKPEVRFKANGSDWIEVGGLTGTPERSYLVKEWLDDLEARPGAFRFAGMSVGPCVKPYEWTPKCNAVPTPWPAAGTRVTFHFIPPAAATAPLKELLVDVNYEIYDGLPVIMKTFSIQNKSGKDVIIDEINGEYLAVLQDGVPLMHVESDYSFALANVADRSSALGLHQNASPYAAYFAGGGTTRWEEDPEYNSKATLNPAEDLFLNFPQNCLLISRPPTGPGYAIPAGGAFDAMRTFEIFNDSAEKERFFLAQRRFYNKLAPQTTEYQIELHNSTHDPKRLKKSIDEMAEMGLERLQIEYPDGIAYEDVSEQNIKWLKDICDYGKAKGVRIGAYQLMIASQGRSAADNCIDPNTNKPGSAFGDSTCLGSKWGQMYQQNMFKLIDATGLGSFDPDGPYHGDPCASKDHPGHRGLQDSQWTQWREMTGILHECQARNLYVTIPDWYFLNGQACTGMGYREASDGLPIALQTMVHRQYMFDATYHKTAGMGWMNFNLDTLQGGMEKDVQRYEFKLFQMLSYGAQTWLRGDVIYDRPQSQAMVKRVVDWSKKYREVIRGDLIHLRRPDGQSLDYVMHVKPGNKEKGMLLVFNATTQPISQTIEVPLYYTGLSDTAKIREREGATSEYKLDRGYSVKLPVTIPAGGYSWFVIE